MKKILIISTSVLLVTLIAFSIWYFFFKTSEITTTTQDTTNNDLPFGSDNSINPIEGGVDTSQTSPSNNTNDLFGSGDAFSAGEQISSATNLVRLSSTPVAGFISFTKNNRLTVRYVDRATGHIYETAFYTGTSSEPLEKTKITNNTIPKVYEAYFKPDGNNVLVRILKDDSDEVENLSLALTPPLSTSGETLYSATSTALRGDIKAVTVGSNNLFFVLKDATSIVSSAFNGSSVKTLFTSAFTDWRLVWAGGSLIVYPKAHVGTPGYAYTLNTSGGSLTKILGPLYGLNVISSATGNKIAYSYYEGGEAKLFVKDIKINNAQEITPGTFSEKCVIGNKKVVKILCGVPINPITSTDLDNWYRGVTHFSDRVWLFDIEAENSQVLIEPNNNQEITLDVYMPQLSPNEDYLLFINKIDLSLWALKLE